MAGNVVYSHCHSRNPSFALKLPAKMQSIRFSSVGYRSSTVVGTPLCYQVFPMKSTSWQTWLFPSLNCKLFSKTQLFQVALYGKTCSINCLLAVVTAVARQTEVDSQNSTDQVQLRNDCAVSSGSACTGRILWQLREESQSTDAWYLQQEACLFSSIFSSMLDESRLPFSLRCWRKVGKKAAAQKYFGSFATYRYSTAYCSCCQQNDRRDQDSRRHHFRIRS